MMCARGGLLDIYPFNTLVFSLEAWIDVQLGMLPYLLSYVAAGPSLQVS